jgi:HEAT repeat protein
MGFFGFGKSDNGKTKIDKLRHKATNAFGQALDRQYAMKSLFQMGTPEAIEALLERYSINANVSIVDQDEKRELYEWLVSAGEKSVGPIENYVSRADGVYWPLRALKEIAGIDRAVDSLLRALDRAETLDTRVNEQKAQLVSNLRDFEHPRVLERLKTLCRDPNDDVRMMALDGLLTYGEAEALPIVAERLLEGEESHRIRSVLFEQLVDHGWSLANWQQAIEAAGVMPAHYTFGARGEIVRNR